MADDTILPLAKFGPNEQREDASHFIFLLNLLKINLYLALVMATFNRLTDSSKSLLIGSSDDPVFDDLTKEIIMTKFSFPEYDL